MYLQLTVAGNSLDDGLQVVDGSVDDRLVAEAGLVDEHMPGPEDPVSAARRDDEYVFYLIRYPNNP